MRWQGEPLNSFIFENVGKLRPGIIYEEVNIFKQLLKIFNMNGFFHKDIQGCNNIELDNNNFLHVIDLDNINYYEQNNYIKIFDICIDLAKVVSCIESYIHGKGIQSVF